MFNYSIAGVNGEGQRGCQGEGHAGQGGDPGGADRQEGRDCRSVYSESLEVKLMRYIKLQMIFIFTECKGGEARCSEGGRDQKSPQPPSLVQGNLFISQL